jgi:hypothetical protein
MYFECAFHSSFYFAIRSDHYLPPFSSRVHVGGVYIAVCFLVCRHFEILLVVPSVYYLQDLVFRLLLFIRESTFSPGFNLVLVFLRRCGLDSVPMPKIFNLIAWVWLRSDFCPSPVLFWSGPLFDSLFLLGLMSLQIFLLLNHFRSCWSAGWDLSFFVRPSVASHGPDFNLC